MARRKHGGGKSISLLSDCPHAHARIKTDPNDHPYIFQHRFSKRSSPSFYFTYYTGLSFSYSLPRRVFWPFHQELADRENKTESNNIIATLTNTRIFYLFIWCGCRSVCINLKLTCCGGVRLEKKTISERERNCFSDMK